MVPIQPAKQITLEMESHPFETPIPAGTDADLISEPSESLILDVKALLNEVIDGLPIVDEEQSEETESMVSAFTMVVEGTEHYKTFEMRPKLSRILLDDVTFRLPKIDLPDSWNLRKYQSTVDISVIDVAKLPPIRTDANYKIRCQPSPPPQDDKAKKKIKK